mmetsp:Transcript_12973/g.32932  ORF Transcript_12973/g.32932 Transcript_12973/m.32932 type:complete len:208 (-) Transcript_12973:714-1337(-)
MRFRQLEALQLALMAEARASRPHHRLDHARRVRKPPRRRIREDRGVDVFELLLALLLALGEDVAWHAVGQDDEQRDAHRKAVGERRARSVAAAEHARIHVPVGAVQHVRLGLRAAARVGRRVLCKARVGEVRTQLLVEEDVVRLEVAVPDRASVQVEKRLHRLAHDLQPLRPRERLERRREAEQAKLLGIGFGRSQSDAKRATTHQR